MSWRRFLLVPQLLWYALRSPRDQASAWDRYWSGIVRTGPDGEVFWDAASAVEQGAVLDRLRGHADPRLPLVDIGCGNGRQARALTGFAPRVLALDRSAAAIGHARRESGDDPRVEFRVADITEPGLGERLHAEFGDVNVHVRGVLHVLDPGGRRVAVANLAAMLGRSGTADVSETDVPGDGLETLLRQGATPTRMPEPLRRLVAAGIRPPDHFGRDEVAAYFPADRWQVLAEGPVTLHGVPLRPGQVVNEIPGYGAVLRPRA